MVIWWLSHPYPPYDSELGTQGAVSSWLQPCSLGRCLIQTGGCWWKFKTGYPHIYSFLIVEFVSWTLQVKIRHVFGPGLLHPSLPRSRWHSFSSGISKKEAVSFLDGSRLIHRPISNRWHEETPRDSILWTCWFDWVRKSDSFGFINHVTLCHLV